MGLFLASCGASAVVSFEVGLDEGGPIIGEIVPSSSSLYVNSGSREGCLSGRGCVKGENVCQSGRHLVPWLWWEWGWAYPPVLL